MLGFKPVSHREATALDIILQMHISLPFELLQSFLCFFHLQPFPTQAVLKMLLLESSWWFVTSTPFRPRLYITSATGFQPLTETWFMRLSPSYIPVFVPSHLVPQPPLHSGSKVLCCLFDMKNAKQLVIHWASPGGHRKNILNNGGREQDGILYKLIHFSFCKPWLETCHLGITKF